VHDLFEILGLPTNAAAREVRRACARRPRRLHPDFHDPGAPAAETLRTSGVTGRGAESLLAEDLAVDFMEASAFTDRIQAAFFEGPVTS
jgi:hypothetical protein